MKTIVLLFGCSLAITPAFAVKPCEELKTEIAAKLDAKGVQGYQLGILAAADVKDQTVVGSCEGGAKKITYAKGDQPAEKPAQKDAPAAPKGK